MANVEKYDDPLWEYMLKTRLMPYLPFIRDWWSKVETIEVDGTGVYPVRGDDVPNGLYYRVSASPARSPIKNVQLFPFIPTVYLQISGVSGGANRMVSKVCASNFQIEEFTVIEKHNLPGTYHQGQFVAFVPTAIMENNKQLGKWTYLTVDEMIALANDYVLQSVKLKMLHYEDKK